MQMSWIDWTIVLLPMVAVFVIAVKTNQYVQGVSDFLAAGRSAGRYLVCTAQGMASLGLISVVAVFEMIYQAGFAIGWWSVLATPVALLLTLSGFIIYRYRETRVMTMAELFEKRYSRNFRVFAGILMSISGIVNYGIFPAVGGRFFVYFCGLPEHVKILGVTIETFVIVMFIFLSAALLFVTLGGQLTIMVTDCVQGLFSYGMYIVVAVALLYMFSWDQISVALQTAPANESMINPFQTSKVPDFNIWYVLIGLAGSVYMHMAWQGTQGFNASAATPHEAKMGGILGHWRGFSSTVMITLLAICAYTYLRNPEFADGAAQVNAQLATIENTTIQTQMRVPMALAHFLPVGIKGVFAAIMLFLLVTTDVSYLHSWGSIVIQDVVMPFRRTPLTPEQHIRWLRWSIAGVAIFAFFFSWIFRQTDYILMFFNITGAIYLGGAGSIVIGGLYWRKGSTAGAYGAMIVGSALALAGIAWQQYDPAHAWNGQYVNGISMAAAILAYVGLSLLTGRGDFNLDRLLHRGQYAVDAEGNPMPEPEKPPRSWRTLLGIDDEFTRTDKAISISLFAWSMLWFAVFIVGTVWNLIDPWPDAWWSGYWYVQGVILPVIIGTVTGIWFTIGGVRDLRILFQRLRTLKRDVNDDGWISPEEKREFEEDKRGFEVISVASPAAPGDDDARTGA
jgi:SSS family solute:Na+ symporter